MSCCAGDEKTHGCCAAPKDSCKGRAAQIVSISGQIVAWVFLAINLRYATFYVALLVWSWLGLPGMAFGIWFCYAALLIAIVGFGMATCCCTGERGWNISMAVLIIASCFYLLSIACLAVSHGRVDEMLDKNCDDDEEDCDGDDDWLHQIFGIMYGCVIFNLLFSMISAYLLKTASPDWLAMGDADAPPVVMAAAADVELANTKA